MTGGMGLRVHGDPFGPQDFSNETEAAMWLRVLVTVSVGAVIARSGTAAYGSSPNGSQSVAAAVHYLDHLRSCTPYTYKYPEPLAHAIGETTIRGKSSKTCQVTLHVPKSYTADCEFSPAAIKALTTEAKYREARAGKLSGSLSEVEGQKFGKQCKWLWYPGR